MTWRLYSFGEQSETGVGKSGSEYLQPSRIFDEERKELQIVRVGVGVQENCSITLRSCINNLDS
jgi:hypothetical protein